MAKAKSTPKVKESKKIEILDKVTVKDDPLQSVFLVVSIAQDRIGLSKQLGGPTDFIDPARLVKISS